MKLWPQRGKILAALGIVVAAVLVYAAWTYTEVRRQATLDETVPADAIIVLGAAQYNGSPSPVLKARLDHAAMLFAEGYANIIVTTGGYGPDPNFSEAHVGARYLSNHGVDASQIMTEQGSGSTHATVLAASRLMHSHGWTRAIVVSDGFHLHRLKRMFEANDIEVYTSPALDSVIESSPSTRIWYSLREVGLLTVYRLGRLIRVY